MSPTVVRIERDLSEDGTQTGNVVVWTSPKAVAYPSYQYTSSFNTNLTFTSLMGSQVRSVEVTVPSDSLCLVEVGAGTTQKNLFQPVSPLEFVGSVTATVTSAPAYPSSVTATVTSMPAVSLDGSASIDGTLPVTVEGLGPLDGSAIGAVVVIIILLAGYVFMAELEKRGHRGNA